MFSFFRIWMPHTLSPSKYNTNWRHLSPVSVSFYFSDMLSIVKSPWSVPLASRVALTLCRCAGIRFLVSSVIRDSLFFYCAALWAGNINCRCDTCRSTHFLWLVISEQTPPINSSDPTLAIRWATRFHIPWNFCAVLQLCSFLTCETDRIMSLLVCTMVGIYD